MATMKQLSRFNAAGIEAMRALLVEMSELEDQVERRARALAIINDPKLCEPVEGAGEIDLDAQFERAFDFASHVYPAIQALGPAAIRDKGINLFLEAAYIDQLITGKPRIIQSYFLDEKFKAAGADVIRNYRNTLFVYLTLYSLHHENEEVCQTLLGSKFGILSNAAEKVSQKNEIVGSKAAMELVVAMFFDPKKGGYRKANSKKGSRKLNAQQALKELSSIVFSQCARNYDIERMTVKQLFKLVPNTKGLAPWKEFAKEKLADEQEAAQPQAPKTRRSLKTGGSMSGVMRQRRNSPKPLVGLEAAASQSTIMTA